MFVPLRQQTPWKPVRDLPTISQRASTFLDRICYAYQYLNGKTETDPPESRYARARRGFTNPLLTSQPSRREASTRIRSPVFVEASHFSIYCVRGITGFRRDLLIEPRAVAHPVSCEVVASTHGQAMEAGRRFLRMPFTGDPALPVPCAWVSSIEPSASAAAGR